MAGHDAARLEMQTGQVGDWLGGTENRMRRFYVGLGKRRRRASVECKRSIRTRTGQRQRPRPPCYEDIGTGARRASPPIKPDAGTGSGVRHPRPKWRNGFELRDNGGIAASLGQTNFHASIIGP